jgi:Proteasome subunit
VTILVGVCCTDGVVIGADSMATSSMGPHPLIKIQSNDKLQIVGDRVILATTGAVGLSQRLKAIVDKYWNDKGFQNSNTKCMTEISKLGLDDFIGTHVPRTQQGLGFGALLAAPLKDGPCLIEFGTTDFQPEIKHGKMFWVSTGSGQVLADPFLAFVNRVLWQEKMPTVELAKIGVYWCLSHTIKYAPGHVGEPIRLGVLKRRDGQWHAAILEERETEEQAQFIVELERRIGVSPTETVEKADSSVPPRPPGEERL